MAVSVRGRSSVMPCLDQYGRLSTLCLLLSWQLPAYRGAVGSVVLDILSFIPIIILRKGMVPSVLYLQHLLKIYDVQAIRCVLCFSFGVALLLLSLQVSLFVTAPI